MARHRARVGPMLPTGMSSCSVRKRNFCAQALTCIDPPRKLTVSPAGGVLAAGVSESFIAAVVGWVDLRSEVVPDELADLSGHPRFRGVRHVVQDEPDDRVQQVPLKKPVPPSASRTACTLP